MKQNLKTLKTLEMVPESGFSLTEIVIAVMALAVIVVLFT